MVDSHQSSLLSTRPFSIPTYVNIPQWPGKFPPNASTTTHKKFGLVAAPSFPNKPPTAAPFHRKSLSQSVTTSPLLTRKKVRKWWPPEASSAHRPVIVLYAVRDTPARDRRGGPSYAGRFETNYFKPMQHCKWHVKGVYLADLLSSLASRLPPSRLPLHNKTFLLISTKTKKLRKKKRTTWCRSFMSFHMALLRLSFRSVPTSESFSDPAQGK